MFVEHQPQGIMHTFDPEMIECLFDVAIQHKRMMTVEHQEILQTQRKQKLQRQELKNK